MTQFEHAVQFTFETDRFDTSSELPPDANAGNRFYGRDVAELLAAAFAERGYETSFLDEDWGWQTHAVARDGAILELSVSHDEGEWSLLVRFLRKGRFRRREEPIPPDVLAAVEDVFRREGVELQRV